jgi:predicted DNA-binding protein (MmcQ/YjbR family)
MHAEEFADLVERPGIIQAPYFARNQWVALETEDALTAAELKRLVRASYDLVLEKVPKKDARPFAMMVEPTEVPPAWPVLRHN